MCAQHCDHSRPHSTLRSTWRLVNGGMVSQWRTVDRMGRDRRNQDHARGSLNAAGGASTDLTCTIHKQPGTNNRWLSIWIAAVVAANVGLHQAEVRWEAVERAMHGQGNGKLACISPRRGTRPAGMIIVQRDWPGVPSLAGSGQRGLKQCLDWLMCS